MRRTSILLAILLQLTMSFVSLAAPRIGFGLRVIGKEESPKNVYEDDKIKFTFDGSDSNLLPVITIENKTEERAYVVWSEARMWNESIAFGTDTKATMTRHKDDEVLYPGRAVTKSCTSSAWVGIPSPDMHPLSVSKLKKNDGYEFDVILPIKFADGTLKDYVIKLKAIVQTSNRYIRSLKIDMSSKDVSKIVGDPDSKDIDKSTKTEVWLYNENARLTFKNGNLYDIELLY